MQIGLSLLPDVVSLLGIPPHDSGSIDKNCYRVTISPIAKSGRARSSHPPLVHMVT